MYDRYASLFFEEFVKVKKLKYSVFLHFILKTPLFY